MNLQDHATLEHERSYADIFDLVKKAVKKVLGLKRSGLLLYIGNLPLQVGAYHQFGSNGIVLNRRILDLVSRSFTSYVERNSFIFTLLLHEYLHSLGFLDEEEVDKLVYKISLETFGEGHLAVQMALNLPTLKILPSDVHDEEIRPRLEFVEEFDRSEQPYIV